MTKILLLDGYSTRTLACVRSWGKRGIAFAVGGETRWDMSLWSRFASERFVYTSPKRDVATFIEDINHHAHEFGADCVFPTSEAAIMACNQHRHELACMPLIPEERAIELMFSKLKTVEIARSLGIAVPNTMRITTGNVQSLASVALDFPVAVKSESSAVIRSGRVVTSLNTSYVWRREDLIRDCRLRLENGQAVLVQQFIDGYGIGVSGVFAHGHPIAVIGHRRIRESDPCGGPSALAEAIEIEPHLFDRTCALISAIGVTGPAMVEYRIERRTGRAFLMEINGRLWGSVLLASAAGLDLPHIFWKMLNGIAIQPSETRYQAGTRGRYLIGDTKHLLLCLKGRPHNWPGNTTNRWTALTSYIGSFFDKRTKDLIFTPSDPLPFCGRLIQPNS